MTISKNKRYELAKKASGLSKVTFWVPSSCEDDFKLMAAICCDNRDLYPSMLRSFVTGRVKGLNSV